VDVTPILLRCAYSLCCRFFFGASGKNDFHWALAIFFAAGVSDGIDGLLARRLNRSVSSVRSWILSADKLMLVTALLSLQFQEEDTIQTTMADGNGDPARRCYSPTRNYHGGNGVQPIRPSFYGKVSTVFRLRNSDLVIFHAFDLRFGDSFY